MKCTIKSSSRFFLNYINYWPIGSLFPIARSLNFILGIFKHIRSASTILNNLKRGVYIFKSSLALVQKISEYIVALVTLPFSVFDHLLSSHLVEDTIAANCDFLSTRQLKLRKVVANLVIPAEQDPFY